MTERALAFACRGAWLYGILSLPQASSAARRGVLIVVGGPQYRAGSHRQFTLLARDLAAAGIPAMRFDYRGMGDSEGDLQTFENVDADLRAAIDRFMAEVPGMTEVVLWGLCDGASAAALYAPQDARVAGLVLLNPWVRTEEGAARATIKHYYKDRLFDPRLWNKIKKGEFDVKASVSSLWDNVGKAFSPNRGAGDSNDSAPLPERMHGALTGFHGRVLVVLSGADLTAQEFADLSSRPGAWQRLLGTPRFTRQQIDKADHTFSRRPWQDQVSSWTRDWLRSW
ncbi:hydrolase 1, exosortase A system-associated [Massilia sp. Mn16-1_5]|uniref:hydrolase 1, exosortase A system-associated n=1 Tax=Massilia sp. Mn16-1_5 TaxID=2079199 RepID=UPI00109E568A|nr:hydrolase 1, exosortase A system-associated [Massilia sp. Mn16-1_5]THC41691.1 hydrolase 1, exosortase A system-associated [Massilia sp. Mn16-1_5]